MHYFKLLPLLFLMSCSSIFGEMPDTFEELLVIGDKTELTSTKPYGELKQSIETYLQKCFPINNSFDMAINGVSVPVRGIRYKHRYNKIENGHSFYVFMKIRDNDQPSIYIELTQTKQEEVNILLYNPNFLGAPYKENIQRLATSTPPSGCTVWH